MTATGTYTEVAESLRGRGFGRGADAIENLAEANDRLLGEVARLESDRERLLEACRAALGAFGGEPAATVPGKLTDGEALRLEAVLHLTDAVAKATGEVP